MSKLFWFSGSSKITCLFGFHEWKYSYASQKNKCIYCRVDWYK